MIELKKHIFFDKARFLLFCIFFTSLPFVHSLTFPIGFPLKISEITLFLIVIFLLFRTKIEAYVPLKPYAYTLSLFLLLVSISTFINIFWDYPYTLNTSNFRFNPNLSSIFKTFYVYFAISASAATYMALKWKGTIFINIILVGAILAALYAWYLFWFSLLGIHYHTLPGTEQYPQAALFNFGHFIRCGTFKEGNHMGLYLVTTVILAFYKRNYFVGVFLLITTITTASTIAIFTGFLFVTIVFVRERIKAQKYTQLATLFLTLITTVIILYSYSPDFRYLTAKIIPTQSKETADAVYSQNERWNLSKTSLKIALENPIIGIGLTKFSAHYPHFNSNYGFNEKEEKMLPNNIYFEILSETGLVAFIIFIIFLVQIFLNTNSFTLKTGLALILLYWMAYPTFTILFLWVYIGICWFDGSKTSTN